MMKVALVTHNSFEYWQLVELRSLVLRQPLNLVFSKEELAQEYQQLHFGIFENNKAIACMVLVPQENNKMKMRQVAVHPEMAGQSLGSTILKFCENYAHENGYNYMFCHARDTAQKFYLKNGYQIQGESFIEVGIEHYYMFKKQ